MFWIATEAVWRGDRIGEEIPSSFYQMDISLGAADAKVEMDWKELV